MNSKMNANTYQIPVRSFCLPSISRILNHSWILSSSHLITVYSAASTGWIGGWVGPRGDLDALKEGYVSREKNDYVVVIQPAA